MDTTINKANELRDELKNLFNTDEIGFACSETDFGVSCYLTVNGFKIRVSDHEATNSVRVEKEIMFNRNFEVSKALFIIEQIAFPERFEFVECKENETPTHIKFGKKCIIKRK